jgi:ectoine hydroxylase-related dioxygenase (phytanoyl-CoA dioxygenase family)
MITASAQAEFDAAGFTVVRGAVDPGKINRLRLPSMTGAEADEFMADAVVARRVCFEHPVGNATDEPTPAASGSRVPNKLEQCSKLPAPFHALWTDLACDPALVAAAEALLGGPVVVLKDKFVFKQRGGPGFTPHMDLSYGWHRFVKRAITAHIAFDEADAENSAIQVARGCHGCGRVLGETGPERELPQDFVSRLPFEYVCLSQGDVLWFDGLVPHKSEPNTSDRQRGVYYVSFARADHLAEHLNTGSGAEHVKTGSGGAHLAADTPAAADAADAVAHAGSKGAGAGSAASMAAYDAYYRWYWGWTGEAGAFEAGWAGAEGKDVSMAPTATPEQVDEMVERAWELFRAGGDAANLVPGCVDPAT